MFRKANLANCGFAVYLRTNGASVGVKKEHANCVKLKAVESLISTRFMDPELAKKAVDSVFNK